jgi:MerR family transcriptional regulator, copper efflux regulator
MGEKRDMPTLKIGQLARRLGLNVRTLRYYEDIGLLPPPSRTEGGYRLYSEADEQRLRFVLQAKQVGLSLEEIGRILELGRHGSACDYVREAVSRHIATIDAQIAELQRLRATLSQLAAARPEQEDGTEGQVCVLIERWPSSPTTATPSKEAQVTTQKRNIEVFTAGCPICDPVVQLVRRIACPSCNLTLHNVKDDPQAAQRAKAAKISRLPMVLVDGKLLECCQIGTVTEAALRAAGVGTP